MDKKRLDALMKNNRGRDLLKDLADNAMKTYIGYINRAEGEFINWLCKAALDEICRLKKENEWTPASQDPPREEKTYWVQVDTGAMFQCRWTEEGYIVPGPTGHWRWNYADLPSYTRVVAWRRLPELWEGEEEES